MQIDRRVDFRCFSLPNYIVRASQSYSYNQDEELGHFRSLDGTITASAAEVVEAIP